MKTTYRQERIRKLMLAKTYRPRGSSIRWAILARAYHGGYVLLACREKTGKYAEYCVFTDLLSERSIPSDSYCGSRKACLETFIEKVSE